VQPVLCDKEVRERLVLLGQLAAESGHFFVLVLYVFESILELDDLGQDFLVGGTETRVRVRDEMREGLEIPDRSRAGDVIDTSFDRLQASLEPATRFVKWRR
jgi:hypothetical protein